MLRAPIEATFPDAKGKPSVARWLPALALRFLTHPRASMKLLRKVRSQRSVDNDLYPLW